MSRPRPGLFSFERCDFRRGTASMPVREKQSRRAGSRRTRPVLWSRPGSPARRKPGICARRQWRAPVRQTPWRRKRDSNHQSRRKKCSVPMPNLGSARVRHEFASAEIVRRDPEFKSGSLQQRVPCELRNWLLFCEIVPRAAHSSRRAELAAAGGAERRGAREQLFTEVGTKQGHRHHIEPDRAAVHAS